MKEVAPFAGAWIEIMFFMCHILLTWVAPFAGAWIEILLITDIASII